MTERLEQLSKTELQRVKHLKKTHPAVRKLLHRVPVNQILHKKKKERPTARFKSFVRKKEAI